MAINDPAGALAARKRMRRIAKASATAFGAGALHSTWPLAGTPVAGSGAGSINGVLRSRSDIGALGQTNPASGNTLYLSRVDVITANVLQLMLLDRLWDDSGIAMNVVGAQAITMPGAITRYADGEENILIAECISAWGVTGITLTASYTNSAGVSGRSATATVDGSPVAGQSWIFNLQAGDTGIQSIQSVSRSGSTGAAGSLGLVIAQPRTALLGSGASAAVKNDLVDVWNEIAEEACLYALLAVNGVTTGLLSLGLEFREG
jgi:hypothetical protein